MKYLTTFNASLPRMFRLQNSLIYFIRLGRRDCTPYDNNLRAGIPITKLLRYLFTCSGGYRLLRHEVLGMNFELIALDVMDRVLTGNNVSCDFCDAYLTRNSIIIWDFVVNDNGVFCTSCCANSFELNRLRSAENVFSKRGEIN